MSATAIKAAVRFLGGWCAMVFFVVLLTTIFSFLGTIICAVLAGMMMGAAKHQRWQAIPVAVVFPAVIFFMLRSTKAELLGRQVVVLSLLCFGAFWLTYGVTSLLLLFEARKPPGPTEPGPGQGGSRGTEPTELGKRVESPPNPDLVAPLTVADLQGLWRQPVAAHNGDGVERRIEIEGDNVVLTARHADGQVRRLAVGRLAVARNQADQQATVRESIPTRLGDQA